MSFKSSSLLCLALLLACSSAIHAFDITKLLGQYPEFSTFNKYLTDTKLAAQINNRNTITVLAVENGALAALSGKSQDAIKAVISTHVVLDFFDEKKLMEAQGSGEQLTTLYQTSGLAVNKQGFLKVALVGEGEIAFGSAVSGAPVDAELVRTVTSEPYNISILQVSKAIVFPGADSQTPAAQSGAAKAPVASQTTAKAPIAAQTAKAPVASQTAKAPVSSQSAKAPVATQTAKGPVSSQTAKTPVPSKTATAPAPSVKAAAPSPVESIAESPEEALAPEADAPVDAEAPGPVGADVAADAPAPKSSSARTQIGLVGAVMGFASLLVVL